MRMNRGGKTNETFKLISKGFKIEILIPGLTGLTEIYELNGNNFH